MLRRSAATSQIYSPRVTLPFSIVSKEVSRPAMSRPVGKIGISSSVRAVGFPDEDGPVALDDDVLVNET
jgi:hypothetical protein